MIQGAGRCADPQSIPVVKVDGASHPMQFTVNGGGGGTGVAISRVITVAAGSYGCYIEGSGIWTEVTVLWIPTSN